MNQIRLTPLVVPLALLAIAPTTSAIAKPLRERKPALDMQTSKPLADIQNCLTVNWIQAISFPVSSVPNKSGISYDMRSHTGEALILDVKDEKGSRFIKAYLGKSRITLVKWSDHFSKIKTCL